MQQRGERPESRQMPREIAKRRRSAVVVAGLVDQHHLVHQPLVRELGKSPLHFGVVQRQKRQPAGSIPTMQPLDLLRAEFAVSVVDHDIGLGAIVGRRQRSVGVHFESVGEPSG